MSTSNISHTLMAEFEQEIDQLKNEFWTKHREAEQAAHKLASKLPVGPERTRFFALYEIIRTAPRESMP